MKRLFMILSRLLFLHCSVAFGYAFEMPSA